MQIENGILIKVETSDIVKGRVIVPQNVHTIQSEAFTEVGEQIKAIELPDSLTTIKTRGITSTQIQEIRIPANVTEMEPSCITNNNALTRITILCGGKGITGDLFFGNPVLSIIRIGLMDYLVHVFKGMIYLYSNAKKRKDYQVMNATLWKPSPEYEGPIEEFWCFNEGLLGRGRTEEEAKVELDKAIFISQNQQKIANLTIDDVVTLREYEYIVNETLPKEWLKDNQYTLETSFSLREILEKQFPHASTLVRILAELYAIRRNQN